MIKSSQQFAYLLNNFLAVDSDAFISVGNEFHSIPPTVHNYEKDPLQYSVFGM